MRYGIHPLFADDFLCIPDTCQDILVSESRILMKYGGFIPTGCKKFKDEIYRNSRSPDNGFAGKN